jgi:predicted phosphodiesterase
VRRIALLSDVHANLEALEAVLRDVEAQKPDVIAVLGDVINYGPNPRECLTLIAVHADILIAGNHEKEAALPEPDELEDDAREMLQWTLQQICGLRIWERLAESIRRDAEQAAQHHLDGLHLVHASASKPYQQYVWPGHPQHHLQLNRQLDEYLDELLASFTATHSFVGHTHVPAALMSYAERELCPMRPDWNRRLTFIGPRSLFYVPAGDCELAGIGGRKIVFNPGSVGQPRDGDWRASWALYDGDRIAFRRVEYDVQSTAAKLQRLPLSEETRGFFSGRLTSGK